MSFTFRKAYRENVGLLIGLAGGTGSGKTFSAFRLASGIAGDKPFAVIDTEAGRAKHYADQFNFDHGDLAPPFRPEAYIEAIHAADKAGYPVIIVDSVSHIWSGDGGVLDWQEDELDRMAGQDYKKREACKMAAWIKPKMSHKKFVQSLLQVRAHVILCFRAEEKIEMVREDGKLKIVPKQTMTGLNGWVPVCEKNLPFELTTSFLLTADHPGVPHPIKLQAQHKALFPVGKEINEEAGKRIAEWASGGKERVVVEEKKPAQKPAPTPEQKATNVAQANAAITQPEPKPHARGTITGDADEGNLDGHLPPARPAKSDMDKMLAAFAGIGMAAADVESKYNKPLTDWTTEDLAGARKGFKFYKSEFDLKQVELKSVQEDVI